MTVSSTTVRSQHTGDGSTSALGTGFEFDEDTEVKVTRRIIATGAETVLTVTTHYTVAGGSGDEGTVTPTAVDGVAVFQGTDEWTLERVSPITQETEWVENDDFPAASHEAAADKLTFIAQERDDKAGRSLVIPATDLTTLDMELPNSVDRASLFLAFDADGEPIASSGVTPATVTVSAFGETLIDDADAAAARTTLDAQEAVIAAQGDIVVGDATPEASVLSVGAADTVLQSDGTDPGWATLESLEIPLPRSYLAGLTLSNDTDADHDIAIAVGECRDSTHAANMALAAILTKQLDATWAAGDDAGGLNATDYVAGTSGPEVSTRYHIFLIKHADGTVDAGFDKDDDATNLLSDSGYTYYRRIGSIWTDASENFLAFTQHGDTFLLTTPPSVEDTGVAEAGETMALPVAPNSWVTANLRLSGGGVGTWHCYIYGTDQTSQAPSTTVAPLYTVLEDNLNSNVQVFADSSSEIGIRSDDDGVDLLVVVLAYIDRRGRDD